MATVADLILRTEEIVYGTGLFERPDQDKLNGAINDSVTSAIVDTGGMWQRGDYAERAVAAGTVGEIVYVEGVSTNTLTIERAQRGSTAQSWSDNDPIRRNPSFSRQSIDQKIQTVVDTALWPHVWTWYTGSLTFTTDDHLYDLAAYIEDVVSIYQADINSDGKFAPIQNGLWEVVRELDSNVSANGTLLRLARVWDENTTVYYTGKRRPAYADIANVGADVADLVPYAVAGMLLSERAPQVENSSRRSGRSGGRDLFGYGAQFTRMFEEKRDQLRRRLLFEHPSEPKFQPRMRSRW